MPSYPFGRGVTRELTCKNCSLNLHSHENLNWLHNEELHNYCSVLNAVIIRRQKSSRI